MPTKKPAPMPRKVVVAGKTYSILPTPKAKMLEGALGMCDGENLRIYIRDEQAADERRETVLHEMLHAILKAQGIDLDAIVADLEEKVVSALSPGLFAALRGNPKLVKYITAKS